MPTTGAKQALYCWQPAACIGGVRNMLGELGQTHSLGYCLLAVARSEPVWCSLQIRCKAMLGRCILITHAPSQTIVPICKLGRSAKRPRSGSEAKRHPASYEADMAITQGRR